MKGVESYMHRSAKQIVGTWLRKRSRVGVNFKGLQPLLPHLPVHPKKPMFGVYEEYPVGYDRATNDPVGFSRAVDTARFDTDWDRWVDGNPELSSVKRTGIPTVKELTAHEAWKTKVKMECVFDLGVVDAEGKLCYVIEICHKNPMSDKKIAWLAENGLGWCELSAEWVMNRVKPPFDLSEGILRSSD